jgi:DNA-binding NarL/FixJ family response regulator
MPATKLNVMLVEDDDFTRSTVKSALIGQGFNIVYDTALVKEGIEFAKKNRPDVAVLDYNLGKGPNGIDLANQLRKIQPEIGIVLLTAFLNPAELDSKISQLPAGSRYLVKHSVSDIKILVKEIIQSSKYSV